MNKTQKLIQLLIYLIGNKRHHKEDLCERFDISERGLYRYLNDIEACGFVVNRDGAYYNVLKNHQIKPFLNIIHFSQDELSLLKFLFQNLNDEEHKVAERLITKLNIVYDSKLLKTNDNESFMVKVKTIQDALAKEMVLDIKSYSSGSQSIAKDRRVEPISFTENYEYIWALDLSDDKVKKFKVSRMAAVSVSDYRWTNKERHDVPMEDVFRMGAQKLDKEVSFRMDLLAYNLLKEEYPQALAHVQQEGEYYNIRLKVANYQGVGRFVLGLLGRVTNVEPQAFSDYLKGVVEKHL